MTHEEALIVLLPAIRHAVGKTASKLYLEAKFSYFDRLWQGGRHKRKCAKCGNQVKWKERSIDHIIPQSLCIQLDLGGLTVDPRNFQLMHITCNEKKAHRIDSLPPTIKERLAAMGATSTTADASTAAGPSAA